MTRVPSSGWYVEVDHPSGATRSPEITAQVNFSPGLNGRPEITVPVRKNEYWSSDSWDDQPMRVFFDGDRLPIGVLRGVQQQPGRTELTGRGGTDLTDRVVEQVFDEAVHSVAERLIKNQTPYAADVDRPTDQLGTRTLIDASSQNELQDATEIADSDPLKVTSNGEIEPTPVAFTFDAQEESAKGIAPPTPGLATDGKAASFAPGLANASYDFTLEHVVPNGQLAAEFRLEPDDTSATNADGFLLDLSGPGVSSSGGLSWLPTPTVDSWRNMNLDAPSQDLQPGQYTLTVTPVSSSSSTTGAFLFADALTVYDTRFESGLTFDTFGSTSNGGSGEFLSGPGPFAAVKANTRTVDTVGAIDAASLTTSTAGATLGQVSLSDDRGQSFTAVTNANSISASFAGNSRAIQGRAELAGKGTQSGSTPTDGVNPQKVTDLTLTADLLAIPIVGEQRYEGSVATVLNELAQFRDFIWEVSQTGRGDDNIAIRFTRPGLRQSDISRNLADFRTTRSTEEQYKKAVVLGSTTPIRDREIAADHGTAVSVSDQIISEGRISIVDPNTGENYLRGIDYEVDYDAGAITTQSSGDITNGQTLAVSFDEQPRATFSADDFDAAADQTLVEEVPTAVSETECKQAAVSLVSRLGSPLVRADVTLPDIPPGVDLVDQLNLDGLPTDSGAEIVDISQQPGSVQLTLGSRETVGAAVQNVTDQLRSVTRRV